MKTILFATNESETLMAILAQCQRKYSDVILSGYEIQQPK